MNKRQQNKAIKINQLLLERFGQPFRSDPRPKPLDMLLATILSQNTNDNNSYKAYQNLKSHYKNWSELRDDSRENIELQIKIAGLGKQKSSSIKNFLTQLFNKKGELSLDYLVEYSIKNAIDELTSYKGVGVKTASCVMLFALGRNVCPVDTHVHRTVNRVGLVKANAPDKTFYLLNDNFPENIAHSFHTNHIRLGREVCLPNKPKCSKCPLLKICKYEDKNLENVNEAKPRSFMLLDNV